MSSSCQNCMNDGKIRFLVVADEDFNRCMRIPQEQGSHFRNTVSETIKLDAPNGCVYDIEVCREMGEIVLRSGWDVFATAHHIEEGDSLVFKSCGSSTFKVKIYSSCGGSQKTTSCVNPPSEKFEDIPPSASCDHHVPGKDVPCTGHVQTRTAFDYFMSVGSRLTKAQDEKVLEMAHTIRSEIPLYAAVMNKSNVDLKGCFISIPLVLVESFREEAATVKLEAPDSNIYNCLAAQHSDNEIVFKSGWDAFVVAHHVQESDLLVFRHKGICRLEIFILDPSGCQKTSSCFVKGDTSDTQENDDSVAIIDPPSDMVDIIDVSSSDDNNIVAEDTAKSGRRKNRLLGHCAKTRRVASTSIPSIKSEHDQQLDDLQASVEDGFDRIPLSSNISKGPSHPPYITSRRVTLAGPQEKIVLEKVLAIRSEFPIFVAVMSRSNIGDKDFSMRFAMEYATRCLPSTTHGEASTTRSLILQLEGSRSKEWHTILHVQGGHSRAHNIHRIVTGWQDFVSDNHLRLGDICLFELKKKKDTRRLKMTVHLIRKPCRGI